MRYKYLILILSAIVIVTNIHAKKLSKTDLAYLYNENNFTDFSAKIYHVSNELSTVYINIRLQDFYYLPGNHDSTQIAKIKVLYEMYESWDSKNPMDTASFLLTDTQSNNGKMDMLVDFNVRAVFPNNYILKIVLTDLNRTEKNSVNRFYNLRKSDHFSGQNFFISDEENKPVYSNILSPGQPFFINYNDTNITKLYVRYYNTSFPLARPPFAPHKEETFTFEPDSVYSVELANGKSHLLELPHRGMYLFQTDIKQKKGITLFQFDEVFPEIATPLHAIYPLRYLTTQKEFDNLLNYEDYKSAVDNFWLERASNQPERAKKMIARYYARVQDANLLFSALNEGWKTDRGLIFIIYGPPSEVYRDEDRELWVYGEQGNRLSIKFYFSLVDNPFTQNDLRLQRSSMYKSSWYIAIQNWQR